MSQRWRVSVTYDDVPWRPADTRNGILHDLGAERVTIVVIPDASHALMPEQPDAVVNAVRVRTRTFPGGGIEMVWL